MDIKAAIDVVEKALHSLRRLAQVEVRARARPETRATDANAEVVFEHEGQRMAFDAHVRRRLSKEAASQLVAEGQRRSARDVLVVASGVTDEAGALLREAGINYLDAAGNCYIRTGALLLFVSGQKNKARTSRRRQRAFQKAGLKIIYALLEDPRLVEATYRTIAEVAGVSRGAVGYVTQDLERLGYMERDGRERSLRDASELAERWATGFAETLRPELLRGRFRFAGEDRAPWRNANLKPGVDWWGGEVAADVITGHLRPERLTLYTRSDSSRSDSSLPEALERLYVVPDPEGPLEILDVFWTEGLERRASRGRGGGAARYEHAEKVASPLLTYADLIASGASRNLEIARLIRERHLTEKALRRRG